MDLFRGILPFIRWCVSPPIVAGHAVAPNAFQGVMLEHPIQVSPPIAHRKLYVNSYERSPGQGSVNQRCQQEWPNHGFWRRLRFRNPEKMVARTRARKCRMSRRIPRRAINEFMYYYHHERNHQGIGNRLIDPRDEVGTTVGSVECRDRLGGLLKYYYRQAA